MSSPLHYFAELTDPRVERTRRHVLGDIVFIAIAAILCGAGSWDEMERFGKAKRSWLKSFLQLPHGIPSHDTFNRVFQALSPEELEKSFLGWVSSVTQHTQGEVVAIDGKALRGSRTTDGKSIVHMVSAWASANSLVLGQRKTDAKSNEITAIPELLRSLELVGATVTIDAIGCQKNIAEQIVKQKADYVLAVKENQPTLLARARGDTALFGCGRSEPAGQCLGVAVAWSDRTHPGRAIPQGHRQTRAGDSLLHHQPDSRCHPAQHRDPATLGHRKQAALGAGRGLRRRPEP
jgi:DDE_Tnp_1-associated/Transposase DDE domain